MLAGAFYIFFIGAAELTRQDVSQIAVFTESSQVEELIEALKGEIGEEPVFTPSELQRNAYRNILSNYGIHKRRYDRVIEELKREVIKGVSVGNRKGEGGEVFVATELHLGSVFAPDLQAVDYSFRPMVEQVADKVYFKELLLGQSVELTEIIETMIDEGEAGQDYADGQRIQFSKVTEDWLEKTASKRAELEELEKGLELIKAREFEVKFGVETSEVNTTVDVPFSLLVQTNVTRFGAMIIIIFFVSILVNLYRYLMRLSAYYEARGDILSIMSVKHATSQQMRTYVDVFSPESYDFGRAPKSPSEQAVELAKTIISKGVDKRPE